MAKRNRETASRDVRRMTDDDLHLFGRGRHFRLYQKLGAHLGEHEGEEGCFFGVWAPNAERVSVIGDFNDWDPGRHPLFHHGGPGIWEGFAIGVGQGVRYKYHVRSKHGGYTVAKSDPFGFFCEVPPETASVTWRLDYDWGDRRWLRARPKSQADEAPISVYEVHLGSWRRHPDGSFLGYREAAHQLADYVREMGYTHVELLPVMEHPFYGSWGYQITGYFAPTARYGNPQDFQYLVDHLHQQGIGVLLDWVPSHFPDNENGLVFFDGTHLFEPADPKRGKQPEWGSFLFDYARPEVRSFLISNAAFWLDRYHIDGLRVDAVASMLYLDYSRQAGEWVPNVHGGRENLEAIQFLRELNDALLDGFPDARVVAEESTAWPLVSRPTWVGGLGFDMKWDMGWMNDTLEYFRNDPIHRKFHHGKLTFRMMYAFSERFCLALSHDEVVHGKGSLLGKMPGDPWQKMANLRLLFAYQYLQPGKKLGFMGGEIGQWREWDHEGQLAWDLLAEGPHQDLQRWVRDLNRLYRDREALHRHDFAPGGFQWIDCGDAEQSILAWLRLGGRAAPPLAVVLNFTPVVRENYRIGVPRGGVWREVANSDATFYGGSGAGNYGSVEASPLAMHGRDSSLTLTLPPLGALVMEWEGEGKGEGEGVRDRGIGERG